VHCASVPLTSCLTQNTVFTVPVCDELCTPRPAFKNLGRGVF
jgi:hypothetical protein